MLIANIETQGMQVENSMKLTLRHSQNCGLLRLKKLFYIAISYFHFNYKNATLDFTAIQPIF